VVGANAAWHRPPYDFGAYDDSAWLSLYLRQMVATSMESVRWRRRNCGKIPVRPETEARFALEALPSAAVWKLLEDEQRQIPAARVLLAAGEKH
jgi:hypothetical protein